MAEAAAWHVLGDEITQSTTLKKGGGGIADVYTVPYQIDTGPAAGHSGSVTLPATAFNPANVKAAVQAQVDAVHTVASVTS
jgi:hypothetical protein